MHGNRKRYQERLLGQKFGLLVVDRFAGYAPGKKTTWKCRCDCGGSAVVRNDCLVSGATRSCGCLQNQKGRQNPRWKGCGEISGRVWNKLQADAKRRGLLFTLKIDDAWRLFLAQERRCALTGLYLHFSSRGFPADGNASLDRIDSTFGYTLDNVQWVEKRINFMKQALSQDEFQSLCAAVVSTAARKSSKLEVRVQLPVAAPICHPPVGSDGLVR